MDVVDKKLVDRIIAYITNLALENGINISNPLLESLNRLLERLHGQRLMTMELISLLDKPEDLATIHRLADINLKRLYGSVATKSFERYDIIFISLTLIQLENYDSSFYKPVEETYWGAYKAHSTQNLNNFIRQILDYYRKTLFFKFANQVGTSYSQYITWPLVNCVVPKLYLGKFFEFIFDIYKVSFNCKIPETIESDFKSIFQGIRANLNVSQDGLNLELTNKSYILIESTKNVIAIEAYESDLIALSIHVLRLIDRYITLNNAEGEPTYFLYGLKEWSNGFHVDKTEHKVKSRKKAKLRLSLGNSSSEICAELIPPVHQLSFGDYTDLRIEIVNDDELLFSNRKLYVEEISDGCLVESDPIKIKKPLGKLEYRLLKGDKLLYTSADTLYRKTIAFASTGKEIKRRLNFEGEVYFFFDAKDNIFKNYSNLEYYLVSKVDVSLNDTYTIGEDTYSFVKAVDPFLFGDRVDYASLVDSRSSRHYDIYRNISRLVFELEKKTQQVYIEINNVKKPISDFKFSEIVENNVVKYEVDILIPPNCLNCVNLILGNTRGGKTLATFFVFVDGSFESQCISKGNGIYDLSVKSSWGNIQLENVDSTKFSHSQMEIYKQGRKFYYIIPWEFDLFRLDDAAWRIWNNYEYIWYEDIGVDTVLTCWGTQIKSARVFSKTGKWFGVSELEECPESLCCKLKIGFLLNYLAYDMVKVKFYDTYGNVVKTIDILMTVDVRPTECKLTNRSNEDIAWFTPVFYGRGQVALEILNATNEKVWELGCVESGVKIELPQLESGKIYSFVLFQNIWKGFAKVKKILFSSKYSVVNWNKLSGLTLIIKEVSYQDWDDINNTKKYLIRNVGVKFTRCCEDESYEGKIFNSSLGSMKEFKKINPVKIFFEKVKDNGEIEVNITTLDGDGLLLDKVNESIYDSLSVKNAVDIFSYTLMTDKKGNLNEKKKPNRSIKANRKRI